MIEHIQLTIFTYIFSKPTLWEADGSYSIYNMDLVSCKILTREAKITWRSVYELTRSLAINVIHKNAKSTE